MDLPTTVTFDWPSIVQCAQQKAPEMPATVPHTGQSTEEFLHSYEVAQAWGQSFVQRQQCQVALQAWIAGWEAGRAGKPNDPSK